MHTRAFVIVLLACLGLASPVEWRPRPGVTTVLNRPKWPRQETNRTDFETSVYVCQNFDFGEPCILIPLGPTQNGQPNFWMAPAPGGPGPFRNGNYTVGSWGPSRGVYTWWSDDEGYRGGNMTYPGTGHVDQILKTNVDVNAVSGGWGNDIWRWWATWQTCPQ